MANKDLNVFEILGEKEPDSRKPIHRESRESDDWNEWSKYFGNRIEERHTRTTNGQERNAPDRFFDDEIIRAMSQNRPQPPPVPTPSPPVQKSKSKNKSKRANTNISASANANVSAGQHKTKRPRHPVGRLLKRIMAASDSVSGSWKGILTEVLALVLILVVITQFFISISYVSGDSMTPEFSDGDRVLIQRFAKGGIEKGDVIVFETEKGDKLIKRVIATEGDTVDISKNQGGLYVNGEAVEEDYIYTVTAISDDKVTYPIVVTQDAYFVLGDNRTNSKDSRNSEIGLIQKKDVIGKVILSIRGNIGEKNETAAGKDTE